MPKTSGASKEQRLELGRARILDAARTLFEEGGVGALNIRAIAARARMPTMTLYSYFPGKVAIIRALWSRAFEPLFAEMDAVEAAEADPKLRLLKVSQTLVDYWLKHPDRYRIVFLIEDRREDPQDPWFIEETEVVPAYLRFAPMIGAARGDPDGDYRHESEALLCALTGVAHMLVTVSEYPWARSDLYVETILRGFC